jgi:hypothetical protein
MQLLKKLSAIATGWYNFIEGSAATKQMMTARLEVCDTCPDKTQLSAIGTAVVHAINNEASTYICGNCNCPLAGKTANPNEICPARKWLQWQDPVTYFS